MSVNLCSNLQTNSRIAFKGNDDKKSYTGSAAKGAIAGAAAGYVADYFIAKNATIAGSEKTISVESLSSKKVTDYLSKLKSPIKCQASMAVDNAKDTLIRTNEIFTEHSAKLKENINKLTKGSPEHKEAVKDSKIVLKEAQKNVKILQSQAFSFVKDYLPKDNQLTKRAGIGAVVGAAALMVVHSVYGKEKHSFENLKPIS